MELYCARWAGLLLVCHANPRGVSTMSSSKDQAASGRENSRERHAAGSNIDRRNFMGAALGVAAGAGAAAMMPAAAQNVPGPQRPTPSPTPSAPPAGSGL